jgi:sulfur relay (sulfurtransferase) DsrF/TusC family protein
MGTMSILLRRPPYGCAEAAEAIRHALGGIAEEMSVNLILVDGGVNAARRGQDPADSGYLNAGEGVADCIDMGASVYADSGSLTEERVVSAELIEGVAPAGSEMIASLLKGSDTVMIF